MNIGIIGAENSHALGVATLINVQKKIRGVKVTHIWGEKRKFSTKTADGGQIPNIVKNPEDMIDHVDGVMIDHRDGKYHIPVAKKIVKAGIPVFVDKPMSTSLAEAKRFVKYCDDLGVPFTTLSSLAIQQSTLDAKKAIKKIGKLRTLHLCGPGQWNSKYGGIWFYGIHQTEILCELIGPVTGKLNFLINGEDSVATIAAAYGLTISMNFLVGSRYGFGITAIGDTGTYSNFSGYDPTGAEKVAKKFTTMFRTGKKPVQNQRMLAPLAILSAMEESIEHKKAVKIQAIS